MTGYLLEGSQVSCLGWQQDEDRCYLENCWRWRQDEQILTWVFANRIGQCRPEVFPPIQWSWETPSHWCCVLGRCSQLGCSCYQELFGRTCPGCNQLGQCSCRHRPQCQQQGSSRDSLGNHEANGHCWWNCPVCTHRGSVQCLSLHQLDHCKTDWCLFDLLGSLCLQVPGHMQPESCHCSMTAAAPVAVVVVLVS